MPAPILPTLNIKSTVERAMLNIVDFTQDHQYQHRSGVTIVPRADGTPVLVELHTPFTIRETKWASSSVNSPPRVPWQADISSDMLYVGGAVQVALPVPNNNADGYVWNVAGAYTYLCTSELKLNGITNLPTGEYPAPIPAIDAFKAEASTVYNADEVTLIPWPFTVFPGNCAVESLVTSGFITKTLVDGVVDP